MINVVMENFSSDYDDDRDDNANDDDGDNAHLKCNVILCTQFSFRTSKVHSPLFGFPPLLVSKYSHPTLLLNLARFATYQLFDCCLD